LLIGFGLLLFPLIAGQSTIIMTAVPGYFQSLRGWLLDQTNPLVASLGTLLPTTLSLPTPIPQTGQEILDSAGQVLGYIGTVTSGLLTAVIILLLAYYWTLDGPRIIQTVAAAAAPGAA
jgi:predicted PurR-regulated permease PerM